MIQPTTPHIASLPPSPLYQPGDAPQPVALAIPGPETPARTPQVSGAAFSEYGRDTPVHGQDGSAAMIAEGSEGSRVSSRALNRERVQLEDFELIRVLGKGCAGRVLLVKNARRNTVHAMKAISKRAVLAGDELSHTLTELSILKRFAIYEPDNDFITRLNCSFTDKENFYFVMDFCPGGDLATQLEIHGSLGAIRTRFYATDLVIGLEDLHRHGIILRDIKPENILLNASGHCVVADFGLSKEFPYRGEPQPVLVARYNGERKPPSWAGEGMGSLRPDMEGQERIVIDRAMSFVGTTDYLAPEVVKGHQYTYAVDWWGLGCILFECLMGRAPFRAKTNDTPHVLYNKILYDDWADSIDVRYSKLDRPTYTFLDALLQKDPFRRLTEPCVQRHQYFQGIDWDIVRKRGYNDPHILDLHPMAEYNTRYFPRLCLEQEPSVDMSTHHVDEEDEDEDEEVYEKAAQPKQLTALNDENTYISEQLKHRDELEGFYWDGYAEEELGEVEGGSMVGDEDGRSVEQDHMGEVALEMANEMAEEASGPSENGHTSVGLVPLDGMSDTTHFSDDEVSIAPTEVDEPSTPDHTIRDTKIGSPPLQPVDKPETTAEHESVQGTLPPSTPPPHSPLATPTLGPTPLSGAMSSMQLESPAASPERLITPDVSDRNVAVHVHEESEESHATLVDQPSTEEPSKPTGISIRIEDDDLKETVVSAPLSILPRTGTATGKPIPSIGQTLDRPVEGLISRLPSGLPASGLSVSDIVSIPSPGLEGPRLIRRHQPMPSIDSIPMARLSIDMHGKITQLGEDDWEAVDLEGDIPSVPNGYDRGLAPSSFLTRLGRRPGTIIASGLTRQTQGKSSDPSRDSSPTKGTSPRPVFESSKKALQKIKAFPKLRSRRNSAEQPGNPGQSSRDIRASPDSSSTTSKSTAQLSPTSPIKGRLSPERLRPNLPPRRNTESGWFERKLSRGKSMIGSVGGGSTSGRSLTQSLEGSTVGTGGMSSASASGKGDGGGGGGVMWGSASEGNLGGGPPRVELRELAPLEWDIGGEKEKAKAD